MSKLYATIQSDRKTSMATRLADRHVVTTAETWRAIVQVELSDDGFCIVRLYDKNKTGKQGLADHLWQGQIKA